MHGVDEEWLYWVLIPAIINNLASVAPQHKHLLVFLSNA